MAVPQVRRPAVAGYFYPSDASELAARVDRLGSGGGLRAAATGVMVPHGSFTHAGAVIGATLGAVHIPRRCILLGPSHTGSWMPWSLMGSGAYRTPLGDVPVDSACAEALRSRCAFLEADPLAQRGEHAIEVVLPFLQRLGPAELTIVPVVMGSDDPLEWLQFSTALAQVVRLQEEPVLLVASSDLSHYVPVADAGRQDQALLEAICGFDGVALRRLVQEDGVLMCGYQAVACMVAAAQALGARHATVTSRTTSAAAGGDPDSAIGYAGVVIKIAT